MRNTLMRVIGSLLGIALLFAAPATAYAQGDRYALIVQGASGEEQYATLHRQWVDSLTKILVEQFNGYSPIPGMNTNGELTLGENIGDLGGLSIAYRAYKISLGGKPGPVIDGLTGDQRYYYAWAAAWRAKFRDDALRQQVLANPHAPDMYRANGPQRNIPEFYQTFAVKEGDKMFLPPSERTKIW